MRYTFRGEKAGKSFGQIILGIIIFAIVAQAIYASLAGGLFRRKHDYPFSHPGSTWESEEPKIYLYVVDEIPENGESFLVVDGKEIPVALRMDPFANGVYITDSVTKEVPWQVIVSFLLRASLSKFCKMICIMERIRRFS